MARVDPESPLPFWVRPPLLIAVVVGMAIVKLIVSGTTELVYDEGYYTLWSLELSPGYVDHPPAAAWLIALGRLIAGNSEIGVRLMSILCDIAVAGAIYRIGRLLFTARVAAAAVLWHTVSIAAALGLVMTPDAPSILFWALTLWAVAEFVDGEDPRWWLLAGLFAGLGLESKLTNGFLVLGLLLFLLSSRERRSWLRLWQVWAAPVIALAVLSPLLAWNAAHGWVTFWFQGRRMVETEVSATGFVAHFSEFVVGQALAVGPALAIFAVAAGILLARRRDGEVRNGLALCILTTLPVLAYFVVHATHSRIELNWLLPVWPGLTLCGAWAAFALDGRGAVGRLARFGHRSQIPYGAAVIAVIFVQAVFYPFHGLSFDRTAEMHGWRDMYANVSRLAQENGARWIVTSGFYGLTGELAAYRTFAGDTLPVHEVTDRIRYEFRAPVDIGGLGWPALYVAELFNPTAPVPPDGYFANSRLLSVFARKRGAETLHYYEFYLVSEPTPAFLAQIGSD
jgi:4-amino-4-deoxy-L-arabinose transferase-like glycosyltransferase